PPLHEVVVLVPREHAQIELPAGLGKAADHRQVRDDVATPVLGEDQDTQGTRQVAESGDVVRAKLDAALVLLEALAVPRHLGLVALVRVRALAALAINAHYSLPADNAGLALHHPHSTGALPYRARERLAAALRPFFPARAT